MFVCLSVFPSLFLSVSVSIILYVYYMYVSLSVGQSVSYVCLYAHLLLSACLSKCPFVCLYLELVQLLFAFISTALIHLPPRFHFLPCFVSEQNNNSYIKVTGCLFVCMYVCLFVCLSVCLSVCLYQRISVTAEPIGFTLTG